MDGLSFLAARGIIAPNCFRRFPGPFGCTLSYSPGTAMLQLHWLGCLGWGRARETEKSILSSGKTFAKAYLNRCQDGGHVIRRAPAVLEDVEAELAIGVHIWVEHLGDEADRWWLVWVVFLERQCQLERPVLKGRVGRPICLVVREGERGGRRGGAPYPKMTAFHIIMLFSHGAPLMPAGGSVWRLFASVSVSVLTQGLEEAYRLKSRMRRRRAAVDI